MYYLKLFCFSLSPRTLYIALTTLALTLAGDGGAAPFEQTFFPHLIYVA